MFPLTRIARRLAPVALVVVMFVAVAFAAAANFVAASITPLASTSASSPASAVCDTDAHCAAWARVHGHGQAGGPLVTGG